MARVRGVRGRLQKRAPDTQRLWFSGPPPTFGMTRKPLLLHAPSLVLLQLSLAPTEGSRKQVRKTLEMREGLGAQNWDNEVLGVSRPGLRGQEYKLMDHQWTFPVLILWEAFPGFYLCIYLSHFRVPRTVAAYGICSVNITPFMSSILASLLRRPVWLCDMRPSLH